MNLITILGDDGSLPPLPPARPTGPARGRLILRLPCPVTGTPFRFVVDLTRSPQQNEYVVVCERKRIRVIHYTATQPLPPDAVIFGVATELRVALSS